MENNNKSKQNQQNKRSPGQGASRPKSHTPRQAAGKRPTDGQKPADKRQSQTRRPNAQSKNADRRAAESKKTAAGRENLVAKTAGRAASKSKHAVKSGAKKVSDTAKRIKGRPPADRYAEEPLIRHDDYGDGFYTDEVALKQKAARQAEEEARIQEELQREPFSRKTRKAINAAICGVILLVVVIVGVVLSLTVLFKSEQIEVQGSKQYSSQEIIDASGLTLGENLFLSDKKSGEEQIEQKLSYVEEAKIDIRIPNTIVVQITEAQPAYVIADKSEFVVISAKGRVLEKVSKNIYDAPVIKGCTLTKTKVGMTAEVKNKDSMPILNEITSSLQKNKFNGMKEIDISNTANITLNYSDRIKIVLGMPEDIDYKIRTAQAIIDKKLSATDMGVLDVSACNGGKKASYYNPDSALYATEPATQAETAATEPAVTEPYYDWQDSSDVAAGGDYNDGYSDNDYYGDGYSDGGDYTNDGYYGDGYSDDGYTYQ